MDLFNYLIHEFMTGIIVGEVMPNGDWVSQGFTGDYMNSTLQSIPGSIHRSIGDREFSLDDGIILKKPVIIGRVILGHEEPDWSVIAIVTKCHLDRCHKRFTTYRYFLCEGRDSLWKIIAWIENYQQQHGRLPVFDPFEHKIQGQPNELSSCFSEHKIKLPIELQTLIDENPAPIIVQSPKVKTLDMINKMAFCKATDGSLSWAFNVQERSLRAPERFMIIHVASEEAYNYLNKLMPDILNNRYTYERIRYLHKLEVIPSIKQLIINNSGDNDRFLEKLIKALADEKITRQDWDIAFNFLGANQAIERGIYSPTIIRLLALRVILQPNSFDEYLNWLNKIPQKPPPLINFNGIKQQLILRIKKWRINRHG
jgi:hypothetical protein